MKRAQDRQDVSRVVAHRLSVFGIKVKSFALDAGWIVVETANGQSFKITIEDNDEIQS